MKLVYTEQALVSLEESLEFIATKVSNDKLIENRDRILDKADMLLLQPLKGQKEPFLEHLGLGHRGNYGSNYYITWLVFNKYDKKEIIEDFPELTIEDIQACLEIDD